MRFKAGDRVRLISIDRHHARLKVGDEAVVMSPAYGSGFLRVRWLGANIPPTLNGGFKPERFELTTTTMDDTRDYLAAVTQGPVR